MKMKPDHYQVIRDRIALIADRLPAHRDYLVLKGKCKDVEKQLRWDAFRACGYAGILNDLYAYLHDDHIDTALRSIILEVGGAK